MSYVWSNVEVNIAVPCLYYLSAKGGVVCSSFSVTRAMINKGMNTLASVGGLTVCAAPNILIITLAFVRGFMNAVVKSLQHGSTICIVTHNTSFAKALLPLKAKIVNSLSTFLYLAF